MSDANYPANYPNGDSRERALAECEFESAKIAAAATTLDAHLFGANDVFFACMGAKSFTLTHVSP